MPRTFSFKFVSKTSDSVYTEESYRRILSSSLDGEAEWVIKASRWLRGERFIEWFQGKSVYAWTVPSKRRRGLISRQIFARLISFNTYFQSQFTNFRLHLVISEKLTLRNCNFLYKPTKVKLTNDDIDYRYPIVRVFEISLEDNATIFCHRRSSRAVDTCLGS